MQVHLLVVLPKLVFFQFERHLHIGSGTGALPPDWGWQKRGFILLLLERKQANRKGRAVMVRLCYGVVD